MAQLKQDTIDDIFDLGRDIEETVNSIREKIGNKLPDKVIAPIHQVVEQLEAARSALWLMLKERGLTTDEIAEYAAVEPSLVAVVLLKAGMSGLKGGTMNQVFSK